MIHRAHKGRSNNSGPSFPDEPTESEYAIQSMLELEEKRLERMLTHREIDDIMQRFASTGENNAEYGKHNQEQTKKISEPI